VTVATGIITTVAGNGSRDFFGDGGPATNAALNHPGGLAVDNAGNLYIADRYNGRIRKVSASTGIITTVAGNGDGDFSGDGGLATNARFWNANAIAVDSAGNLFIADIFNFRIRKVSAATGIITTVAGNGAQGFSGDGGAATNAEFEYATGVSTDSAGNVYIADSLNNRIRRVSAATGIITTVAGSANVLFLGDGGPATNAAFYSPSGVTVDSLGNLFIADTWNYRIRKVTAATGIITTLAGDGYAMDLPGNGGPASKAQVSDPTGIAVDGAGNLYIAD
jgi:sugar lactone lactonase YvrE